MVKKTSAYLLAASLLLNAYLLVSPIDISDGGGLDLQSPDKVHTVMVNSLRNLNPLASERRHRAEITIHDGYIADEVIRKFTVTPITVESNSAYRYLKDPIQWSADSTKVTITTPDFTIIANLEPKP